MHVIPAWLPPILLLKTSNVSMTFAWCGRLRFKAAPLLLVIVASWLGFAPSALGAAFVFRGPFGA